MNLIEELNKWLKKKENKMIEFKEDRVTVDFNQTNEKTMVIFTPRPDTKMIIVNTFPSDSTVLAAWQAWTKQGVRVEGFNNTDMIQFSDGNTVDFNRYFIYAPNGGVTNLGHSIRLAADNDEMYNNALADFHNFADITGEFYVYAQQKTRFGDVTAFKKTN